MVHISKGNSKMGSINSVSLPSIITCRRDCTCIKKCYANKLERIRPSVRNAYADNLKILMNNPSEYWSGVNKAIATSRFFRFHVSGDIVDETYLEQMVNSAVTNKNTDLLCFTKKYELVNDYLDKHGNLPDNLHMIFSVWDGMECKNKHNLPEAHVVYRNGMTTASENAKDCGGNCTECAVVNGGCWNLKRGEQIKFKEH